MGGRRACGRHIWARQACRVGRHVARCTRVRDLRRVNSARPRRVKRQAPGWAWCPREATTIRVHTSCGIGWSRHVSMQLVIARVRALVASAARNLCPYYNNRFIVAKNIPHSPSFVDPFGVLQRCLSQFRGQGPEIDDPTLLSVGSDLGVQALVGNGNSAGSGAVGEHIRGVRSGNFAGRRRCP